MPIITNQDGTLPMDGAAFPSPDGWERLPTGLAGLDGVEVYGSSKNATGEAWYVVVGSAAWRAFVAGQSPKVPVSGRGSTAGAEISVGIRPPTVEFATVPTLADAPTGEGDSVTEYTNDPDLGVVRVGVPTDQSALAKVWSWPSRLGSKALPNGPVAPWQAGILALLPFGLWGLLAWWLYRRMTR